MTKNKTLFISILLIIITGCAVYANSLRGEFLWDDRDLILENRYIHDIGNIPFFFTAKYWGHLHPGIKGQYRPVSVISIAIDYFIWKDNPFGYHLTNLLLHILNCILVYILGLKLTNRHCEPSVAMPISSTVGEIAQPVASEAKQSQHKTTQSPRSFLAMTRIRAVTMIGGLFNFAFLAAIFFAAHPIHTESVTWIKNRFDLLSLAFFLLSTLLFVKYTRSNRRNISYVGSILFFIFALISKEMSITLPFILALYVIYFIPRGESKKAVKACLPFFGFAAFYVILKYTELLKTVSSDETPKLIFSSYILFVFKTIAYYVKLLILPIKLNAEHMLEIPVSILEPSMLLSILLLLVLFVIALKTYNRLTLASFSILWIFLTLLPASNIIFLASRPIAEQRLYIPSVGFCLLLAACVNTLYFVQSNYLSRKMLQRAAIFLAILIIIFYSAVTIMRNLDWRDPLTFWKKTAEASPYSSRAYNNLGFEYYEAGNMNEAVSSYKKAIELNPEYVTPYNNLGVAYQDIGRYEEAIAMLEKAVEIDPDYADAYNNLGNIRMIFDDRKGAIAFYKKVLEINPEHADTYNNLAVLYYYEGEYETAIKYCDKAVELGAPVRYDFLRLLDQYR